MSMISGMKDWKLRSLRNAAVGMVLAVGVTGLAVQGDTTAYAQAPSIQASPLEVQSMQLLAEGVGWAAGQNYILWTRDNGQQWADITPLDLGTDRIQRVFFRTEREGWILALSDTGGELTIRRTQDGGASWTSQVLASLRDGGSPVSMEFTDGEYGWMMVRLP